MTIKESINILSGIKNLTEWAIRKYKEISRENDHEEIDNDLDKYLADHGVSVEHDDSVRGPAPKDTDLSDGTTRRGLDVS